MRVLVACEESQTVTKAFRSKGFEAYSCDLIPCSGGHPEWHIQCDCRKLLLMDWDLVIAHPPCTYFSKAGGVRMFPNHKIDLNRYSKLKEMRSLFMFIYTNHNKHIAIENPVPMKIAALPKPDCVIQPYEFGHKQSKMTYLWLKNLPPLMPTELIINHSEWVTHAGNAKNRSKTFDGIAAAMADQWGDYIKNNC